MDRGYVGMDMGTGFCWDGCGDRGYCWDGWGGQRVLLGWIRDRGIVGMDEGREGIVGMDAGMEGIVGMDEGTEGIVGMDKGQRYCWDG